MHSFLNSHSRFARPVNVPHLPTFNCCINAPFTATPTSTEVKASPHEGMADCTSRYSGRYTIDYEVIDGQ